MAIHFFSQNCRNYPVSSVSWRINILSKKDHLYFSSEKRNICNFTKKVSFNRTSYFFDDFLLISLFSSYNKQKKSEYCHNIPFSLKKIINEVFFNVFRSIDGILNKTPFTSVIYVIWIKMKILPKKWLFQGFFHIFICWSKKTKKVHS